MSAQETEQRFISLIGELLLSLPSDLKVLQEAVADPDLDRRAREIAAGAIVHTLLPQEGEGPFRFVDDALLVRAALRDVVRGGGEAVPAFRARFAEIYDRLEGDVALIGEQLGDTWTWLSDKLESFPRLVYKGRRAAQYVDDDEAESFLYEEGLAFETNYNVTEEQVRNRVRRVDHVLEPLHRRRADEARKIS